MYAEVADSISGTSEYSPEVLSEAISRARERQAEVKEDLNRLLIEVSDTKQLKASIGYRFAEYKLRGQSKTFYGQSVESLDK